MIPSELLASGYISHLDLLSQNIVITVVMLLYTVVGKVVMFLREHDANFANTDYAQWSAVAKSKELNSFLKQGELSCINQVLVDTRIEPTLNE